MISGAFPLLSLVIFLPLLGALGILAIRGDEASVARNAKWTALAVSLAVFVLSLSLWLGFDNNHSGFQFSESYLWLPNYDIGYTVGLDGISVFFVLLSTLLVPLCILASWHSITYRVREYMIAFLLLETMMVGMFAALDIFLFYVFFEAVLLPMFLIIGIWGGERKIYAAFKFFLYTLLGSVLMLVAMTYMYLQVGSSSMENVMAFAFSESAQFWLFLAFFASFAVKVPMWPVHTWLPDAHVEAPTAGSVILAGVLLKMGGYGFLRFSLPMFPLASADLTPLIFGLSAIAVIYTSMVALVQTDMKKLIAYSSVAHMGFVTAAIFAVNEQAIAGSIIQMLSHGIVSAALFLCVGVVYDRLHTREIARYGGLVNRMPKYAFVFMVFMLGSVGLPGTSGFVGEFMILLGVFGENAWVAVLLASGMVLGAAYMLYLYRRIIFGELKEDLQNMKDLLPREILIFAPLLIITLWMGVYPHSFLSVMEVSVAELVENYKQALAVRN